MAMLLAVVVIHQLRLKRRTPVSFWLVVSLVSLVSLVSVVGTLVSHLFGLSSA